MSTEPAIIAYWDIPEAWKEVHASKKAFIRFSHTAKAFGIKNLCFVESKKDPMPRFGDAEINLSFAYSLAEAMLQFPDNTPVLIEEGGVDYKEYDYPENPVFIVGGDFGQLPWGDVSIDTVTPLNAEIALGIVLGGAEWR